jgi:hypothetical protein
MPRLNGTGPENKRKQSGRGLGPCRNSTDKESIEKLGKGMGFRRKSGGGQGLGKRLKSGLKYIG